MLVSLDMLRVWYGVAVTLHRGTLDRIAEDIPWYTVIVVSTTPIPAPIALVSTAGTFQVPTP
jgi:hypothetical protein